MAGVIHVHNSALLEEVIKEANGSQAKPGQGKTEMPPPLDQGGCSTSSPTQGGSRSARERKHQEYCDHLMDDMRRRMDKKAAKRDAAFQLMFASVLEGIGGQAGIMADVNKALEIAGKCKDKKNRELYQQWKENVCDVIQAQIDKKLEKVDMVELEARYKHFAEQYNAKSATRAGTFLEVVNLEEYDPFENHMYTIRYSSKGIVDPLKHDITKDLNEKAEVDRGIVTLGFEEGRVIVRELFDPTQWVGPAHKSTIYGHYFADDGRPINLNGNPRRNESHIILDHFKVPVGKEVVDEELPKGKRMLPGREQRGFEAAPRGKALVPGSRR